MWFADIAFVDRADIKAYVGPPTLQARYEILRSCIDELFRVGILTYPQVFVPFCQLGCCNAAFFQLSITVRLLGTALLMGHFL